ncbi:MAG: hypothetical protein V4491_01100 [Pseudomonadota bacterium]
MMKTTFYARTGAAALAAALAFSPTIAFAQDAAPVADVPVASDPAPAILEAAPPAVTSDPVEIAPVADTAPVATSTKVAKARAAKPVVRSTAAAQSAPAPVIAAAPAPVVPEIAADPVGEMAPNVAPPPAEVPAAAVATQDYGAEAQMAFAGALALLALAGAGVGLSRRRKNRALVETDNFVPIAKSSPQPAIAAERDHSVFAWGRAAPAAAILPNRRVESPIERAKRGPSADNPSLSLKKRLKRAAFFEHRQREVAAGRAQPLPTIAGLPQRLIDKARNASIGQTSFGNAGFAPALQPA